jgi:hypothetical protein
MRKNSFYVSLLGNLMSGGKRIALGALVMGALVCASCSDGADCDETFQSSVHDAQLSSPTTDQVSFKTITNSDGSESVQVTWDLINGAGGYECEVLNVDDPSNPTTVMEKTTVDGTSFTFKRAEDTNYQVSIRTLGNTRYNNTGDEDATLVAYSSFVQGQTVPVGSELSSWVAANLLDQEDEQAVALVGGETYELNGEIDFGRHPVTFRGEKGNPAIIKLGATGVVRSASGLKIKYLDFDCTDQEPIAYGSSKGYFPISCSETKYADLEGTNFGQKDQGYYYDGSIIIQSCMFKNIKDGVFHSGGLAWMVTDLRMDDCIVQLNNTGYNSNGAIFNTYGSWTYKETSVWYTCFQNVRVTNSTFYNIASNNNKNRMFRVNNNTPSRTFATDNTSYTMENCTMIRTFDNKEFANNTPNRAACTINFNNNICYDVFRLQKFIQGNCTNNVDMTTNTIWGVKNSVDSTDKSKWATEEDPAFVNLEDATKELDFTKENGGINLKATGAISKNIGDPRWRD